MEKQKEVIEKIRRFESPTRIYRNFFNSDEMQEFISLGKKTYEDSASLLMRKDGIPDNKNDITSVPQGGVLQTLNEAVVPRLQSILEQDCHFGFAFHKNFSPYGIHTDSGYDPNEVIYKQGIIPLEVSPKEARIHTVIMNEKCYHSAAFPSRLFLKEDEAKHIGGYKKNQPMKVSDLREYWLEDKKFADWLHGFSIDTAFEWHVGDMLVWDRCRVHCSSDFHRFGVQHKIGLMWISYLP